MPGLEATDCPFTVCTPQTPLHAERVSGPRLVMKGLCLVGYVDLEPGSWDTRESDLKVES